MSFNRQDLLNWIQRFEGLSRTVYIDTKGIATIGIGFNIVDSSADSTLLQAGITSPTIQQLRSAGTILKSVASSNIKVTDSRLTSAQKAKIYNLGFTDDNPCYTILAVQVAPTVNFLQNKIFGTTIWNKISDPRQIAIIDIAFNLGQNKFSKFQQFINDVKSAATETNSELSAECWWEAGSDLLNSNWSTDVQQDRVTADYQAVVGYAAPINWNTGGRPRPLTGFIWANTPVRLAPEQFYPWSWDVNVNPDDGPPFDLHYDWNWSPFNSNNSGIPTPPAVDTSGANTGSSISGGINISGGTNTDGGGDINGGTNVGGSFNLNGGNDNSGGNNTNGGTDTPPNATPITTVWVSDANYSYSWYAVNPYTGQIIEGPDKSPPQDAPHVLGNNFAMVNGILCQWDDGQQIWVPVLLQNPNVNPNNPDNSSSGNNYLASNLNSYGDDGTLPTDDSNFGGSNTINIVSSTSVNPWSSDPLGLNITGGDDTTDNTTDNSGNTSLPGDDSSPAGDNTIDIPGAGTTDPWNWDPLGTQGTSTYSPPTDAGTDNSTTGGNNPPVADGNAAFDDSNSSADNNAAGGNDAADNSNNSGDNVADNSNAGGGTVAGGGAGDGTGSSTYDDSGGWIYGADTHAGTPPITIDGSTEGGSGGCFVAGTLISTANGLTPIEEIKEGDNVFTYDGNSKGNILHIVEKVFVSESTEIISLDIETEKLQCTPLHRFYTGKWVPAKELNVGDRIMDIKGEWKELKAMNKEAKNQTVHNFQVNTNHNYFVGKTAILVHNMKVSDPNRWEYLDPTTFDDWLGIIDDPSLNAG